jgi:hypothetical protein
LSELYTGEEKALGLENQSSLDIYTGQQYAAAGDAKQQSGYFSAAGSALKGASSAISSFGSGFGGASPSPGGTGGGAMGYV